MQLVNNLPHYLALMRFEKPIGWLLLLWPTLWALWIASDGNPSAGLVWIFTFGVIVMRSAGCVINDYADRAIDPLVDRTKSRPLAVGLITTKQALGLLAFLLVLALILLLLLPMRVWPWAVPAIIITFAYPYMKRFIQAPQMVLGLAFSFGIPMVYVALDHAFDLVFCLLLVANVCWVLVFDTEYAISDREDDLKIGVKSTAILFGKRDRQIIAILQACVIAIFAVIAGLLTLTTSFYLALALASGLFIYQQWLIRERDRQACFRAFLNNGWLGGILWFGLLTSF
ncbi:MAG: 4-hydroxybenzoate octaprenyltransferase [Gammaproteobacteria bacterium]|nr:4-hydroxybenzoate octaprenyltransferase [Gammaproteobacteria bacterium]